MQYLHVPNEITLADIQGNDASLSAGMYRRIIIPNLNVAPVLSLMNESRPFDKGVEPGSMWYMRRSTHYFIRTKALQPETSLLYPKGDAIVPVNPRAFADPHLRDGDILMSKDSNIGECAVIDGDRWSRHMFSGGIIRLHPNCDRWYLFSFLKHELFKAQLNALAARGATITHARNLWGKCLIPFPTQSDGDQVVALIGCMMHAICEKDRALRERNEAIDTEIEAELVNNQNCAVFSYELPTIRDIRDLGRLDASMYSEQFKRKMFLIENYSRGVKTCEQLGFLIGRGQNLQVSSIGRSIYSDRPRPGFYRLVAPTDISEFRTVRRFRYLGSAKNLATLQRGDVVFGAEGFCKGRVVILMDEIERTVTNIHGITFHHAEGDLDRSVFLGCFLGYLRSSGLVDAIGAGGSGGSLAIGYFHHVPFPDFPRYRMESIARLYRSSPARPAWTPTCVAELTRWHQELTVASGIWDLSLQMLQLQQILFDAQQSVINGETVDVGTALHRACSVAVPDV